MGEINNSLKVNQADQLEASRYKMKAANHNISKEKSEQILETKCQECERKYQKKKRKINMGMEQEE